MNTTAASDTEVAAEVRVPCKSVTFIISSDTGLTRNLRWIFDPVNREIFTKRFPGKPHKHLVVARRKLQAGQAAPFDALTSQAVLEPEQRIKVANLSDIDGQYILLVRKGKM